jgi:hypothetical protein
MAESLIEPAGDYMDSMIGDTAIHAPCQRIR